MIVERSYDAERLNMFLNDEHVYPWVHGTIVGPMDATPLVKNKQIITLLGEYGGMIFLPLQQGLYDFHTFVLKEGRGEWTMKMAHDCFKWMYTRTDAMELLGRVPYGNIAVRAFAKRMGGSLEFRIKEGWVLDHRMVPADIYSFKIQDWMRDAPGLEETGKWFHERLESEYRTLGRVEPLHEEDKTHDRYVGAIVEMIKGGQPYKAAVLYNRWAKVAGYQEISVLSSPPALLDIQEALLLFKDNDFKVISCRQPSPSAA